MKTHVSRETILHETDFCVVGGGLAGLCAAVAAARKGVKTVLVQDRPMLGGNASSEVRMWVRGAHGENNKESGIISELDLENSYKNPTMDFALWDSVLYGMAAKEKNLTLLLDTTCLDAETDGDTVVSITAWQLTTYTFHTVEAAVFADCSGDSVLAPLTGAKWTKGREARHEFGESIEPEQADLKTMGNSCLMQVRETAHKVDFIKPEWAYTYETDDDLPRRDHSLKETATNFWWVEIGGEGDALGDAEKNKDELLKILFGVWDHIKNHGDHGADNWAVDWVGFLPGKRETRRYIGPHVLTQNDVQAGGVFDDVIAYGGWSMDDHNPAGFYHPGNPTTYHDAPSPYGIPFRSVYSVNVRNLLFAGRNISATHAALSSTRVMATCAILGQAVGNAAYLCRKYDCFPADISAHHIAELQQEILYDGCYLPGVRRIIPDVTLRASHNLTPDEASRLFSGVERPKGGCQYVSRETGECVELAFREPVDGTVRIVFDPDYSRLSVSDDGEIRQFSMRCNIPLSLVPVRMPANLAKAFTLSAVYADGSEKVLCQCEANYKPFWFCPTGGAVRAVKLVCRGGWQSSVTNLYDFSFTPNK